MPVVFRPAALADTDAILALQAAYYASEHYPFETGAARHALQELVRDPARGQLWIADEDGVAVGYVAVAFGHSLEYGGRDAFVDELYLAPSHRGRGLGRAALRLAEDVCGAAGVRALHLEVERANAPARALYRREGFADHERILMTKRLTPPR